MSWKSPIKRQLKSHSSPQRGRPNLLSHFPRLDLVIFSLFEYGVLPRIARAVRADPMRALHCK